MSSSKSHFPLGGTDLSKEGRATATCYCGEVQLSFPTEKPGLVDTFICNCTDCRKITASMFASNFCAKEDQVEHVKGKDKLSTFAQKKTIATGKLMTNYFCSNCGTLMYRIGEGFPGLLIMRIGTVDDYTLQETKLKPRIEQFGRDRVAWFAGGEGVEQYPGNYYGGEKEQKM